RVVQAPGEVAGALAAAPRVDVGAAQVADMIAAGQAPRDRDEVAGAIDDLGFRDQVEVGPGVGDLRTLGAVDHQRSQPDMAREYKEPWVSHPRGSMLVMDRSSTASFAHAARRLGAAAREIGR